MKTFTFEPHCAFPIDNRLSLILGSYAALRHRRSKVNRAMPGHYINLLILISDQFSSLLSCSLGRFVDFLVVFLEPGRLH